MNAHDGLIIPSWPQELQEVDVVRARFVMDFLSPCTLQPADFLSLGRILRISGRQMLDSCDSLAASQWQALFQPALSSDPVALRKFQKPAPAYVMTMPVMVQRTFDVGDQLNCEVLFIGTGIPLIHVFLRSLIHLGHLGLVDGEGQFDVTEVFAKGVDNNESLAWRQGLPLDSLSCSVLPLSWLIKNSQSMEALKIRFVTPTRLLVDGKPLKKPKFSQIFPFMLRRVTSMLHAHGGVELDHDMSSLLGQVRHLEILDSELVWNDWRPIRGQGMSVGGFQGLFTVQGQALEDLYWIIAVASLFGVGKGSTYGAGQVALEQ